MRVPPIVGEIERRLLVNYRVDPDVAARHLPTMFRPALSNGFAVAGICLIRLGSLRLPGMPGWAGLRSEGAAHRIAVEWDGPEGVQSGVYIPRRDTDSLLTRAVGGRLYPGEHHRADFAMTETDDSLEVAFVPRDGTARAGASVRITEELTGSQLFDDTAAASRFFEKGAVGWSATKDGIRLDGLRLSTPAWFVEPAQVLRAHSAYFEDEALFPAGSATPDDALVMRRIPVTWRPVSSRGLRAPASVQESGEHAGRP